MTTTLTLLDPAGPDREALIALLTGNAWPFHMRPHPSREQVDAGDRPGVTTDATVEIKRLKRENAELRRANEILKAASAFFAAELDRPHKR